MTKLWIFDVDGTLADINHRMHHFDDQKNWAAFFAAQHLDPPYDAVFDVLHALFDTGDKCIVITGRDEKHRQVTIDWLQKYCKFDFSNDDLYMRKRGDSKSDDLVKIEIINQILKEHPEYKVMGVFEDRHRVIDAWRDAGYYVFECNQTRKDY